MSEEVLELGIEDAFAYGISLVEWPERLGPFWPPHRLEVIMSFPSGNDGRHVSLHGSGWWNSRIRCLKKIYNKKITLLL